MADMSFFKGDKKKKKKGDSKPVNFSPVFTATTIITKGKDKY